MVLQSQLKAHLQNFIRERKITVQSHLKELHFAGALTNVELVTFKFYLLNKIF